MQDKVIPKKNWEFDGEVAACFDDMLKRSIPEYEIMRKLVYKIGQRYVKKGTDIVDLGSSRGESIAQFIDKNGDYNRYTCIEISEQMLQVLRERFECYIKTGIVNIKNIDLKKEFPKTSASLITSILTIQFTPIEYRQQIIQKIYDNLEDGGAFIFVEKVLGNNAELNNTFVDLYYDMKEENGYTKESIEMKRKSLEGVLVPVTEKWNRELLEMAGFKKIDVFWKCLNFMGFIAIK